MAPNLFGTGLSLLGQGCAGGGQSGGGQLGSQLAVQMHANNMLYMGQSLGAPSTLQEMQFAVDDVLKGWDK